MQNQRRRQNSEGISPVRQGRRSAASISIEVVCDDRQTEVDVEGSETLFDLRSRALDELGMFASDPERYVVIGSNRQPIDDRRTIDELIAEGQVLSFRLLPQVAYGGGLGAAGCA